MFFRHVARLIDAWRAFSRLFRTAWRALPGDLLGTEHRDAALVEQPDADRYLDHGAMPIRAQTLGRYVFAREPLSAVVRRRHPYCTNRSDVAARRREAYSNHSIAKT